MKKWLVLIVALFILISINITIFYSSEGNNEDEIKVESPTKDKSIIFFGDSITQGWLTNGYAYPDIIGEDYDFESYVNAGLPDYRVSNYNYVNEWLVDTVNSYKDSNYDYIILEGGINDALYGTPIGKVSDSKDSSSFNIYTFAGGLEMYIYSVLNNWPDAKIGYIITYCTPNYSENNYTWSKEYYKKYIDVTIQILEKWDIPYINLFNDDYYNLLDVENRTYLPDYLHLNIEGYKLISPYIYDWIIKL